MRKEKIAKYITGIVLAVAMVVTPYTMAKAAGKVSVTADKETAAVGDTLTVSVKIEGADGDAEKPEVSVNFDANRLDFSTCSTEYGGGGGGLVTLDSSADLAFTILSGGQASVDVTAIFDGDGANAQTASATVMVEGEDTAAMNEGAGAEAGTGIEAGTIATSSGKLVSSVFADEFMPVGFYKTTVSYEEQMVEAAQFDMGGIVLLYVTDPDGNNGNFNVYDQVTGELSDFLQISGIENRFIIALKAGADVTVPDGFTKATLQWNAQSLEAYSYTGEMPADSTVAASDFFLLYAVSSAGNKGWYIYDQNEGTYQRFISGLYSSKPATSDDLLSQITAPVSGDGEEGGINVLLIIVIALGVLLLGLIIAVIVMAIKLHEYNSYDYIDEDEEDDTVEYNVKAPSMNISSKKVTEPAANDFAQRLAAENDAMPEEMPKTKNIYEQYRDENNADDLDKIDQSKQSAYERDELVDEDALFSPREMKREARNYEDDEYPEKLSRADKKAMKAEEKARKKEEKRLKKEYGEFGPVDWQSWQDAVDGGERTAAHASRNAGVDNGAVRRVPNSDNSQNQEIEEEEFIIRNPKPARKANEDTVIREERQRQIENEIYEEQTEPKDNPMEMIKNIPANDNGAPVQAKPVQQFDLDDDFEFEFLSLDDDEE